MACPFQAENQRGEKWILLGHTDSITAMAISPSGRELCSGSRDGTIRIWDLHEYSTSATIAMPGSVTDIAFSPVYNLAAVSCTRGIGLYESDGSILWLPHIHDHAVVTLAFAPDGRHLAYWFENMVLIEKIGQEITGLSLLRSRRWVSPSARTRPDPRTCFRDFAISLGL